MKKESRQSLAISHQPSGSATWSRRLGGIPSRKAREMAHLKCPPESNAAQVWAQRTGANPSTFRAGSGAAEGAQWANNMRTTGEQNIVFLTGVYVYGAQR